MDLELDPSEWIQHPSTDVAIMPIRLPPNVYASFVPSGTLLTENLPKLKPVAEGAEICIPSLFSQFSGTKIMLNQYFGPEE